MSKIPRKTLQGSIKKQEETPVKNCSPSNLSTSDKDAGVGKGCLSVVRMGGKTLKVVAFPFMWTCSIWRGEGKEGEKQRRLGMLLRDQASK